MNKKYDLVGIKCRLLEEKEIVNFAEGVNIAFEARSEERIPFEPETVGSFLKKHRQGHGYFAIFSGEKMVGGLMFNDMGGNKTKISRVWIAPEYQGNGYAKKLLLAAEDHIRRGGICLSFSS